jgi:type II secretory pathway component PulC
MFMPMRRFSVWFAVMAGIIALVAVTARNFIAPDSRETSPAPADVVTPPAAPVTMQQPFADVTTPPVATAPIDSARSAEVARVLRVYRDWLVREEWERIAALVDFEGVFSQSGTMGYRVVPNSPEGKVAMDSVGLRPDDIITRVNGWYFDQNFQPDQLMASLRTSRTLDLVVMRANVPIAMSLPVGQ